MIICCLQESGWEGKFAGGGGVCKYLGCPERSPDGEENVTETLKVRVEGLGMVSHDLAPCSPPCHGPLGLNKWQNGFPENGSLKDCQPSRSNHISK